MKTTAMLLVLLLAYFETNAQGLTELYKKNQVVLEEDPTFGVKNNWKELFYDIGATRDQGKDGKNKAIVVAPDGKIFMSHRSRHSISMFDKDGNFLKEFGLKGGKESDFIYMPTVIGIMDGKYLVTTAVDGRMLFFDLEGNWVKTVRLNFMPLDNAILKDGKIAVLGHTSWTTKMRIFVAIKDIENGKEKIIWEKFSDPIGCEPSKASVDQDKKVSPNIVVKYTPPGGMYSIALPFTHSMYTRPKLLTTSDGNLSMTFPETGEVKIYTPEGSLVKTFTVSAGERLSVTKEDREEFYKKIQERIQAMEAARSNADEQGKARLDEDIRQLKAQIDKALDPALYPEKLPTLSEIMFDSDNNMLVFAFTKEKDQNQFAIYTYNPSGQKIAESTFVSDKYDLNVGNSKFRFFKGNIIAVQMLKDKTAANPLRLVRFKLKN
jgi:hypothetical protein